MGMLHCVERRLRRVTGCRNTPDGVWSVVRSGSRRIARRDLQPRTQRSQKTQANRLFAALLFCREPAGVRPAGESLSSAGPEESNQRRGPEHQRMWLLPVARDRRRPMARGGNPTHGASIAFPCGAMAARWFALLEAFNSRLRSFCHTLRPDALVFGPFALPTFIWGPPNESRSAAGRTPAGCNAGQKKIEDEPSPSERQATARASGPGGMQEVAARK